MHIQMRLLPDKAQPPPRRRFRYNPRPTAILAM